MSGNDEKKLTFSFSKTKKQINLNDNKSQTTKLVFEKTTLTQQNKSKHRLNGSSDEDEEDNEKDLITSIEDKKIHTTKSHKYEKPVPIVPLLASSKRTKEDIEAIKALIAESKIDGDETSENKSNSDLKVDLNGVKQLQTEKVVETTDDPDYEKINIEDFGMACLRGMGWNENVGIGKSNKRKVKMIEPVLRPRGLGLGANINKKHKSDGDKSSTAEDNLTYAKGACLQILNGKYKDKYGKLTAFDDGLNRIIVQIANSNETTSILQTSTRLVSSSEYRKYTK